MTCEHVFDLATRFLDGALERDARAAVTHHLAACEDCRKLIAALRDAPPEDSQLTAAILRRTTGPVCHSVRDRLCDRVDGTLDPIEAGRVGDHLARCPECASLDRVLTAMRAELPQLADTGPDPEFVAAVLARTSLRPRRVPLVERWLTTVSGLLERPRIALEGAFVAAALLVFPFGMHRDLGRVRPAYANVSADLNMLAHDAWGKTRGILAEYAPRGTFSSTGASEHPSDGTDELDRESGSAQEKRR